MRGPCAGKEQGDILWEFKVAVLSAGLRSFGAGERCFEPSGQRGGTKQVEACVFLVVLRGDISLIFLVNIPQQLKIPAHRVRFSRVVMRRTARPSRLTRLT